MGRVDERDHPGGVGGRVVGGGGTADARDRHQVAGLQPVGGPGGDDDGGGVGGAGDHGAGDCHGAGGRHHDVVGADRQRDGAGGAAGDGAGAGQGRDGLADAVEVEG